MTSLKKIMMNCCPGVLYMEGLTMKKKEIFIALILLICLSFSKSAYSLSLEIENGLAYLYNNQNQTGSWGNTSDAINNEYFSTIAVLETLKAIENDSTASYYNGMQWLQTANLLNVAYIAYRISILSNAGMDVADNLNTLLSYKNPDFTWGGYLKYTSNNFHTALTLQALKVVNYSDQTVIQSAINYLTSTQNLDGGWGFVKDDINGSNVYMTAVVSSTLQQFQRTTSIATAINKATDYLIAHQNVDGGFGSGGPSTGSGQGESTVFETALAYMALADVTTDATVMGNAINYLTTSQLPNGSWNDDPYSTALALKALYLWENRAIPPQPNTGTVTGKVVDASSNQPLGSVTVISGQLSATTMNTGDFTLSDIPAGSQTITFTLAGYATASVIVNVTAGSIINLGTILLSQSPSTGIIKGAVTDASDGQPLSDVTISVTGSFIGSTSTDIDGTFILTDVLPGSVTITALKTGYYPVTGTGTVVAGGILFFNPQISTQPPPTTTGNLTGKVFDGSTNTLIQGAIVSIAGGASTSTDAQGVFLINDITPGTYQVTISASGYINQTYQLMITAGVTTDMQTIYLTRLEPPAPLSGTTLTGTVTDMDTGETIAGAKITVIRSGRSATTGSDGTTY